MINKKYLLSVFIIFIFVLSVVGANSNIVNIEGVDFKIPAKYSSGKLNNAGNSYSIDNSVNIFSIACVDDFLDTSYGFHSQKSHNENLTIGGHDVVYFWDYNSYEKNNVSIAYFSCGDSIYYVSWQGNSITSDIRGIIANSTPSSLSTAEFHDTLDKAKYAHDEQEKLDDMYNDNYYPAKNTKHGKNHLSMRDYVVYSKFFSEV